MACMAGMHFTVDPHSSVRLAPAPPVNSSGWIKVWGHLDPLWDPLGLHSFGTPTHAQQYTVHFKCSWNNCRHTNDLSARSSALNLDLLCMPVNVSPQESQDENEYSDYTLQYNVIGPQLCSVLPKRKSLEFLSSLNGTFTAYPVISVIQASPWNLNGRWLAFRDLHGYLSA